MASASCNFPVMKEGVLLKRQRGLTHIDLRRLKFQHRFCRLTQQCLFYFEKKKDMKAKPKGVFTVARIEIVEKLAVETFNKDFCFQIGNEDEVMYFVAKSENDREEWIEALTIAARDCSKNLMLPHYHGGAYGLVHHQKWSCCNGVQRNTRGCLRATSAHFSTDPRTHRSFHRQNSQDSQRFLNDQIRSSLPPDFYGPLHDRENPLFYSFTLRKQDHFTSKDDLFAVQSQYSVGTSDSGYKDGHLSAHVSRRTLSETSVYSGTKSKTHSPIPHSKYSHRKASEDSVLSTVSDTVHLDTSPLLYAFMKEDYEALQSNLEEGVDPDEANSVGKTTLHLACESGRKDIVQLLLRYLAKVDSVDKLGETPLMAATKKGHLQIMLCLINSDAEVDKQSLSGKSALHEAVATGCSDAVELLLEKGASYQLTTTTNKTPYDLACEQGNKEVIAALEWYMPQAHIPYTLGEVFTDHHTEAVSSLAYTGAGSLLSGSRDGTVVSISTVEPDRKAESRALGSSVASIAAWKSYLAIGTQGLQLKDTKNTKCHFKFPEPMQPDQDVEAQHLVAFTSEGDLVSADTSSNRVQQWSRVSNAGDSPECAVHAGWGITVQGEQSNCITSLSVSPDSKQPWLAVALEGEHKVHLFDYTTQQLHGTIDLHGDASGDVNIADERIHTTFSNDGMNIAVAWAGRLKLFDVRNKDPVIEYSQHCEGIAITGVCYSPTGVHLAAALSNGNIGIFDGNHATPKPLFNLSPHKVNEKGKVVSATSLVCAQDSSELAVGYRNGAIQLWQVPKLAKRQRKQNLVESEHVFEFGVEGGRCELAEDGYAIEADRGSVEEGTVSISHGAVPVRPFGAFKFPNGVRPVSAIISVCHREKPIKSLLKPIAVTLDHCMEYETFAEYNTNLTFFKADHTKYTFSKDGEKVYSFQKIEDCEVEYNRKCATVRTNHFCYLCVGKFDRVDTNAARFAIHEAQPKTHHGKSLPLDYCVCYDLPTCLKTVKKQYPENMFELSTRVFKFSPREGDDPSIEVKYTERFNEGWMITCKSSTKICRSSVHFWDETPAGIVASCEEKRYPPRIKLEVHSDRARRDVVTTVAFQGSVEQQGKESANFPIRLLCPSKGGVMDLEELPVTAEADSAEHCVHAALKALQSGYEVIAHNKNLDPVEFALKFYSRKVVNDHTFMGQVLQSESKHKLHRMVEILQHITNAILHDPKCFPTVCKILEESFPEVATRVKSEYQNCMKQLRRQSSLMSTPSATSTKSPFEDSDMDANLSVVGAEAGYLNASHTSQTPQPLSSFTRVFSATPPDTSHLQSLSFSEEATDVTPLNASEP